MISRYGSMITFTTSNVSGTGYEKATGGPWVLFVQLSNVNVDNQAQSVQTMSNEKIDTITTFSYSGQQHTQVEELKSVGPDEFAQLFNALNTGAVKVPAGPRLFK